MLLTAGVLLALVVGLAYANGGNDVSKGIATLVGSGVSDYRRAVLWGALWTVAGGLLAGLFASELVDTFSGQALLASQPDGSGFAIAVSCGAVGWLILATATGLPVSTTHALLGGLAGAAIAADGVSGLLWGAVARKAVLPLVLSPVLSLLLMALLLPRIRARAGRVGRYCVCLERRELALALPGGGTARTSALAPTTIRVGADCPPEVVGRLGVADGLHWLSAGLTCLSRGLNDTPKILALGVAAAPVVGVTQPALYLLAAVAMALGGFLSGARVTGTLAGRITPMTPVEGLAANLVTSALVASASGLGLPVSTTHVSSSAIIGLGVYHRGARWRTVLDIGVAWLITIPVAGGLAWAAFSIFGGG